MTDYTKTAGAALTEADELLTRAESEGRDLDDGERASYDALLARASTDKRRGEVQRLAETSGPGSTERAYSTINVNTRASEPFANLDRMWQEYPRDDVHDLRERALTAFSENSLATRGLSDEDRETLIHTIETVPGAAAHALVHGTTGYRSAFERWAQAGGQSPLYDVEEIAAVRTALNITTGASGQFSLPTVFDPTLIKTGNAAINPIRDIARIVQITQNVWNGVSVGNVQTYWHAEAAALTDGSPTLAHPLITMGHLTAWIPASWEFFDDSAMVAQLPDLITEAFGFSESTAFVTGTGTSSPLGVVSAISATAGSTITASTRGSFTTASFVDIYAVVNNVSPRFEETSTWVARKNTYNTIRQMSPTGGAGSLFWGDLRGGSPDTLLDFPWVRCSDMASTTTTGSVLAILGDFSRYLIVDRIGTTVEMVQKRCRDERHTDRTARHDRPEAPRRKRD